MREKAPVLGKREHLAARLQAEAPPGGILLADRTERFVRPFFELDDLGHLDIKGKADAVRAYRVVRERAEALPTRGIAGLWLLNRLRMSGYSALLIEKTALGSRANVFNFVLP